MKVLITENAGEFVDWFWKVQRLKKESIPCTSAAVTSAMLYGADIHLQKSKTCPIATKILL